jgi:DNA polymerase-3 subunit epsilon
VKDHNEKIEAFIEYCKYEKSDYIIIGEGRNLRESAFVLVEEGFYQGFGFYTQEDSISNWDEFRNYLIKYPDHPEIYKILSSEHATKNYKKVKKEAFLKRKDSV